MAASGYICKNCGAESPAGIGYVGQPERNEPAEGCEHPHVVAAWELIGAAGNFRVQGGRTVYEAVQWNEATARGYRPRLSRLVTVTENGQHYLHQIDRWVDPETRIEVLP